jgi:hypothetical protein
MSTSVAPAGTSSGAPTQVGLDPCAVFIVLMDETEADLQKAAPPALPAPSGGGGGQAFDRYA